MTEQWIEPDEDTPDDGTPNDFLGALFSENYEEPDDPDREDDDQEDGHGS